jgi:hypothetical protein
MGLGNSVHTLFSWPDGTASLGVLGHDTLYRRER